MHEFNIGDLVKVVKIPTEWFGYVPALHKYYHEVGEIVFKTSDTGNVYRVIFSDGDDWNFPANCLELIPQPVLNPGDLSALFGR